MSTRSIDVMLSRPGIYVVLTVSGAAFVEVDEAGVCWQLAPSHDYCRDGELRPGGWNLDAVWSIDGPFARAASQAAASPAVAHTGVPS